MALRSTLRVQLVRVRAEILAQAAAEAVALAVVQGVVQVILDKCEGPYMCRASVYGAKQWIKQKLYLSL